MLPGRVPAGPSSRRTGGILSADLLGVRASPLARVSLLLFPLVRVPLPIGAHHVLQIPLPPLLGMPEAGESMMLGAAPREPDEAVYGLGTFKTDAGVETLTPRADDGRRAATQDDGLETGAALLLLAEPPRAGDARATGLRHDLGALAVRIGAPAGSAPSNVSHREPPAVRMTSSMARRADSSRKGRPNFSADDLRPRIRGPSPSARAIPRRRGGADSRAVS